MIRKQGIRQVSLVVFLAILMVAASLSLLQLNVQAGLRSSGAGNCGSFIDAVTGATDGDVIVQMVSPKPSAGATLTKSITIQGGWFPAARECNTDVATPNEVFTDVATLLAEGFTYNPQDHSELNHTGGAVLNIDHTGALTLQNLALVNEGDVQKGGGLSGVISGTEAQLLIDNTIVSNGVATQTGGGLYLELRGGARLVISGSQLFSNTTLPAPVPTKPAKTTNQNQGGGFLIKVYDNSQVIIQHTQISSNTANGDGGGGQIIVESGYVSVTDSVFFNNQAVAGKGGGLSIESVGDSPAYIFVNEVVFSDNQAQNQPNLYLSGSNLNLRGNYFGLDELEVTGPVTGLVQTSYTFTATTGPITSSRPITYVWQTTDAQAKVVTTTNALSNILQLSWSTTGTKIITVTATNDGGTITDTHIITISAPPQENYTVFLPLVGSNFTATDMAQITDITIQGSQYTVYFETYGFAPQLPGQHVHFFFNTVEPQYAGLDPETGQCTPPYEGQCEWKLYGGSSPFTDYAVADRPSGATQMCVLVANPDHSVRLNTGNCYDLP